MLICCCCQLEAQLPVTIPWSSTVNEIFPSANYQLPAWKTDFAYIADPAKIEPGQYSVKASNNDAGHL